MEKKWKILLTFIAPLLVAAGCGNESYDYKSLGFSSPQEMKLAFEKGYHTKSKYSEMTSNLSGKNENSSQIKDAEKPIEAVPAISSAENSSPKIEQAGATCENITACIDAMINAAKSENLTSAMEAARRIDGFEKPERGDRKNARKLNERGLIAFKDGNKSEALSLLTDARNLDRLDEEIISNLVYVYSETGNFSKALELSKEGFLINPRRASLWLPYAESSMKSGNKGTALAAFWLAWQFSGNKEKMLESVDKKLADDNAANMKELYISGKSWIMENKRPNF